jgi:hypothetical protein
MTKDLWKCNVWCKHRANADAHDGSSDEDDEAAPFDVLAERAVVTPKGIHPTTRLKRILVSKRMSRLAVAFSPVFALVFWFRVTELG